MNDFAFDVSESRNGSRYRNRQDGRPPCSRLAYIVLALFLGCFGVHNLYAGRMAEGGVQAVCGVLAVFLSLVVVGLLWFPVGMVWSIVNIVLVSKDGNGRWMA